MVSLDELVINLDNYCKNFQSLERIERQMSLREFLEVYQLLDSNVATATTNGDDVPPEGNKTVHETIFNKIYLYILKGYSDKYEICRCLSVDIMTLLLTHLTDNEYYLECIIPVLTKRLGQSEIIEDSEEMRYQLLQQLSFLIDKFKAKKPTDDRLFKSYNDIIDILLKTLRDPFPSVQEECCSIIVALSKEKCFHYRSEVLVIPLTPILRHRQSKLRIAAINALGHVCLSITTNGECILKIITEISPLLMNDMPRVRMECGRIGCLLLLELRDRYSYFDRLLPLVFCWYV